MKERLLYLDSIKGFAIFLMVLGHAIAWSFTDYSSVLTIDSSHTQQELNAGYVWQFIYSFHMALFFLVSGYLSYRVGGGNFWKDLKKKSLRLLVPYFATGFLITIIRPGFGYWFLFSLWELSVFGILLQYVMRLINKNDKLWIDIILIVISYELLRRFLYLDILQNPVADIGYGMTFYLPFFLGFLMRKYEKVERACSDHFTIYFFLFILCFIWKYIEISNVPTFCNKVVDYVISRYHITALFGTLTFYSLFKKGINPNMEKVLSWFGKQTFEIYIFHVFFVLRLAQVGDFWISTNLPTCLVSQLVYGTIISLIAMLFSIVIARFIKHSNLLSKLVLGQ